MDQDEIAEMLARCGLGDRAAFRALYDASASKLFGVTLRILGSRAEAEEALQEAFVKIWNNAGRHQAGRGSAMGWMVSIALNQSIDMLRARDPAVPRLGFPVVDVRDVAEMHLRALQRPDTAGKRYLSVAGSVWMGDMARALAAAYPQRKIATRDAPYLLLRLLALFDKDIRSILPNIGQIHPVSNARAVADMGMTFIPPEQALLDAAEWLVTHAQA